MTDPLRAPAEAFDCDEPSALSTQMMEVSDRLVTAALASAAVQAALAGGGTSRAAALTALELELARIDFMIEGENERDTLTALLTAKRLLEQYLEM
ncbi:MAG: hypothetical protein AB1429_08240 [Pseudomonadota bacterium]|jgi:hypothetical protein